MGLRRSTAIAILVCLTTGTAFGQFTSLGLFGGEVRDIASLNHGGSTELLIATTGRHGIYRCGSTGWEPVFKNACNVLEIEADSTPGNNGIVWAIINGRVYSHGKDDPWDESGWMVHKNVARADTLYGHLSGMYIGGDSTVYRTTDGGRTLSPLATFSSEHIQSIAVYNQTQFCVISGRLLYRCQDDANGFVVTATPLICEDNTITHLASVAIDPDDRRNTTALNRFYVWSDGPSAGLYRTDDGGETWTHLPVTPSTERSPGIRFAGLRDKRRMFVGDKYSDNFGQAWNEMPETRTATSLGFAVGHATGAALTRDPNSTSFVYFATDLAIGQWDMSTLKADEVHRAAGIEDVAIIDIAQIPTDAATQTVIWAATNRGLAKTITYPATTDGSDWLFPLRPQDDLTPLTRVALHPGDLDIVLAGDAGGTIYRTTNGGTTPGSWTAVFSTRNAPFNARYASPEKAAVTAIKAVDKSSTIVFAATAVGEGKYEGAVYRSLNNGTTWDDDFAAVSGLNLSMPVNDLTFLDNMVWAGVGHPQDTRTQAKGLYARLSVTGAANWWKMPTGTELDAQAVLAVEGVKVGGLNILYAATDQGVYCGRLNSSVGSAWSWKAITPDGKHRYTALAADPHNPNRVFVACENEIWSSADGGHSWGLVPPSGTPECNQILALRQNDLLVGTASGLFASPDGAANARKPIRGTPAAAPTSQPTTIASAPQQQATTDKDLLPFKLPTFFGLGIADTVGLWLPVLAWLAITRMNRGR